MICIGLTGAGKTTVLSVLCNEPTESIVPTTGEFSSTFSLLYAFQMSNYLGFKCFYKVH